MRRATYSRGPAGRRLSLATALALAGLILIVAAAASAGDRGRGTATKVAPQPRQPIDARADDDRVRFRASGNRVVVSSGRLLAGRPDQRLRVRVRGAAGDQLGAYLHPAGRPGRRLAEATGTGPVLTLAGLPADPGRYRLAVERDGERLGSTRIEIVAQSRQLRADPPAGKAVAAKNVRRPQKLSLASGDVNADLYFRGGSQASSDVAIASGDPGRTIAASADVTRPAAVLISEIGLRPGSELRRRIPGRARSKSGPLRTVPVCCAPAVAADPSGDMWAAAATFDGGGPIVVNRIGSGSTSFRSESVALPTAGASQQEKPTVAVDPGGAISVGWVRTTGTSQQVVVSSCDLSGGAAGCDAPDAWSDPVAVNPGGLYASPDLDYGPDGSLYASWWNAGSANAVELDRCAAGEDCSNSASWNERATIDRLDSRGGRPLPLFCPIIAAPGGLVGPSPSVEVGPAGDVHVAYSDLRDNADPSNPSRCTATGSDSTFDSYVASGRAPGELPPTGSGVRLSDDGAGDLNDHFLPAIAVDEDGTVEASFYSTVGDPSGERPHRVYASSRDGGLSFSAPAPVSTDRSRFAGPRSDGVDYGDRQGMDSVGGVTRIVWTDARPLQNNDGDLYGLVPAADSTITESPPEVTENAIEKVSVASQASRIECSLDGRPAFPCNGTVTVGPVPNGNHALRVTATDLLGNPVDRSPEFATWTTRDLEPPETTLTGSPPRKTFEKLITLSFAADEPGASFQCSYDGRRFRICPEPKSVKPSLGRHVFKVRAVDVGGNVDPTPAHTRFKRRPACKQIRNKLKRRRACALERCKEIRRKKKRQRCTKQAKRKFKGAKQGKRGDRNGSRRKGKRSR